MNNKLKKIGIILFFILIFALSFAVLLSWYQGKVISEQFQALTTKIEKEHGVKIDNLAVEKYFFSQNIAFDVTQKMGKVENKLFRAQYKLSYTPVDLFIKRKNVALVGLVTLYDLTAQRLAAWETLLTPSPFAKEKIVSFLSKSRQNIELESSIDIYKNEDLTAEFLLSQPYNLFDNEKIMLDELSLIYSKDAKKSETQAVLTFPSLRVINAIDAKNNDKRQGSLTIEGQSDIEQSAVAKIVKPISQSGAEVINVKNGKVMLIFTRNAWQNMVVEADGLTSKNWFFDKFKLNLNLDKPDVSDLEQETAIAVDETKNQIAANDNEVLINQQNTSNSIKNSYQVAISSQSVSYDTKELGKLSLKLDVLDFNSKVLNNILNNAHVRYEADLLAKKNKYELPIYYFAQWLNLSEDFLQSKPKIKIAELRLQKSEDEELIVNQEWHFSPKELDYGRINHNLALLPFVYTDKFALSFEITQPQLEKIIDLFVLSDSALENVSKEDILNALNEMNRTYPFVEAKKTNSKKQSVDFLNKKSSFVIELRYEPKDNLFVLNDAKYEIVEFQEFFSDIF